MVELMVEATSVTVSLIVHDDFTHIGQALDHLIANTAQAVRVIITINHGNSQQIAALATRFSDAQIMTNPTPKGFAANHNAILRSAETPFIVLLNDDALLQPNALDHLLTYLQAHPDCGIAGPIVRNPDGSPQISAFSDPTLLRMVFQVSGLSRFTRQGGAVRQFVQATGLARRIGLESLNKDTSTRIVPVIVGVCMVVRRTAVQQAGLMDEDTRVYGEEFGWQRRLREKGWNAALVGEAEVIHLNTAQDVTGWKLAEHRKGMLSYFVRYQPRWQAIILRSAITFFHGLYAVLWWPLDRARSQAHGMACQVGWHWKPA